MQVFAAYVKVFVTLMTLTSPLGPTVILWTLLSIFGYEKILAIGDEFQISVLRVDGVWCCVQWSATHVAWILLPPFNSMLSGHPQGCK